MTHQAKQVGDRAPKLTVRARSCLEGPSVGQGNPELRQMNRGRCLVLLDMEPATGIEPATI